MHTFKVLCLRHTLMPCRRLHPPTHSVTGMIISPACLFGQWTVARNILKQEETAGGAIVIQLLGPETPLSGQMSWKADRQK